MPSIIIYFGWVHRSLFTILILFFAQISAQFRPMNEGNLPSISSEEKMLLEKFGLSELNDFVARGRGKGSVSRLPFVGGDPKTLPNLELTSNEENEEQKEDEEELAEIGTPPPNLFQVIMPSMEGKKNEKIEERKKFVENEKISKKGPTKEEPGPEDYEKLAKILQKFLSQRKINEKEKKEGIHKNEGKMSTKSESKTTTKMPLASSSKILGKSTVIEEDPKKGDEAMMISLSTGTRKKFGKENLNGEEILSTELEGVSWSGSSQKIEGIVHHSQSTIRPKILGKILIQPSRPLNSGNLPKEIVDGVEGNWNSYSPKESTKIGMAYVSVLREGLARQSDKDQDYTFVASITLIRDQGKVILVDTGLATDINGRTDLIEKLGRLNIAPPGVNFVVTTHGHADHSGNTNDFPDAFHFQGTIVHHRTKFNFSNLFEDEKHKLTENVELIRIPGHTPEDIGVVVSNTDRYGRVIVAGDTFLAAEDMNFPMMWRPLAWNETAQEESRRRILCLADFVVPGHGKVFRVTDEMRARVDCGDHHRRIGNKKTRNE